MSFEKGQTVKHWLYSERKVILIMNRGNTVHDEGLKNEW